MAKQLYIYILPFTREIVFGNNKLPLLLRYVTQLIYLLLTLWHGFIAPSETTMLRLVLSTLHFSLLSFLIVYCKYLVASLMKLS